jgi:hypothetical protein
MQTRYAQAGRSDHGKQAQWERDIMHETVASSTWGERDHYFLPYDAHLTLALRPI